MAETESMIVDAQLDCGPIGVEIAHSPLTDLPHILGDIPSESFRHRLELRFTNRGSAAPVELQVQLPAPPTFFFELLRMNEEGELVDLTEPQIDVPHTGVPEPSVMRFDAVGQTTVERVSYAILPVIAPEGRILPGEFVLRLKPFVLARLSGDRCRVDGLDLPITILRKLDE